MLNREELAKVYMFMSRKERRQLARVWGVTLANCTRYCTKAYAKKIKDERWAMMLTMWPADVWNARLKEAIILSDWAADGETFNEPGEIKVDLVIPNGLKLKITVNGREL